MNLIPPAVDLQRQKSAPTFVLRLYSTVVVEEWNKRPPAEQKRRFLSLFKRDERKTADLGPRSGFPTSLTRAYRREVELSRESFPQLPDLLRLHRQAFEILRQDVKAVRHNARKGYPTNENALLTEHLAYNDFSVRANRVYAALVDPSYPDNASTNRAINGEIELLLYSGSESLRQIDRLVKKWRQEDKLRRRAEASKAEIEFKRAHGEAFTVFRP